MDKKQGVGAPADEELCPECSRELATRDGLCADCWAFVNGQFGVGA